MKRYIMMTFLAASIVVPVRAQEAPGGINDIAWSPAGETIFLAADSGVWRLEATEENDSLELGALSPVTESDRPVQRLVFSRDGALVAAGDSAGNIIVWDVVTNALVAAWQVVEDQPNEDEIIWALDFTYDHVWLAAATDEGVYVLNIATDESRQLTNVAARALEFMAFSDPVLMVGDVNNRIQKLVVPDGLPIWQWRTGEDEIGVLAISPNGNWVVSGGANPAVRIWLTIDGVEMLALETASSMVSDLVWSPDSAWLAAANAGSDSEGNYAVQLWDATLAGEERPPFEGHGSPVIGLTVDPSGAYLASLDEDGGLYVWDVAGGAALIETRIPGDH